MSSIITIVGDVINGTNYALRSLVELFGISPSIAGTVVNTVGLFIAGFITVLVVTLGIISYIKGSQFEPFMSSYEDDAFVRGRAGTVMGILTIVCAVWFLFAIVYIYFIQ